MLALASPFLIQSPSVVQLADWIVMLEDGHLSIQGTPAGLRQQAWVHLSFLAGVKEFEPRKM